MKHIRELTFADYGTGHPWYYHLGGSVLTPKQIKENVCQDGYRGYLRDDIAKADQRAEPSRSAALRKLRDRALSELKRDLSGYRQRALELLRSRRENMIVEYSTCCDDVHTNISLKHNHLYNGFAHLVYIDELLNQQGDLFG